MLDCRLVRLALHYLNNKSVNCIYLHVRRRYLPYYPIEKANNIYNETKHSFQHQINSYIVYPALIINESQNKFHQAYDRCVDVKQKDNSKKSQAS